MGTRAAKIARLTVACSLAWQLVACGSDDNPPIGSAGASGSGAQAGSSSAGASGGGAGASSAGASGASSAACQMYCECHEKNCAATAIPGGASCAAFCASMSADQLACRQNMCGLVPAQPDNNHCAHSVGIDECL